MKICKECEAKCCKYFVKQIDAPTHKSDFENLRWFLAHKGVSIYIERRRWYMEIANKCRYLTKDHRCRIYSKRPLICREHSVESCEHIHGEFEHEMVFKNIHQFDRYLEKRFKKRNKNPKK